MVNTVDELKNTLLEYSQYLSKSKLLLNFFLGGLVLILVIALVSGWFTLIEPDFTSQQRLDNLTIILAYTITISFSLVIVIGVQSVWLMIKTRKKQKEIAFVQSYLIKESYLKNFEFVEPGIVVEKGDPRHEKIFNHLSLVFPDIWKKNKDRIKKQETTRNSRLKRWPHVLRKYELPILTEMGAYVVHFLDTPNFQDIEKLIKEFTHDKWYSYILGIPNIIRLIIVIKNPDEDLINILDKNNEDEFKNKMKILKQRFPIDIILEDEIGYSPIWFE